MEIAMRTAAKKSRGRPRKPTNTELITALIEKHDAMARRTYDKIEGIWHTHVPLEGAERLWRRICRKARAGIGVIPELAIARIPSLNDSAGRKFLEGQIGEILAEMGSGPDDGSPLPALTPQERPPPVKPSRTLAEARAQSARLQTYLITLKARIGHYRGPGR